MSAHLDLDALADVLVEEGGPAAVQHLRGCVTCAAGLEALRAADASVAGAVAALAGPPLPVGLTDRLDAALARERRALSGAPAADVVPLQRARRPTWLPWAGGVAAAAVLVTAGVLLQGGASRPPDGRTASSAAGAAAAPRLAVSNTETDYGRDGVALRAAVPALLRGSAGADRPQAAARAREVQKALDAVGRLAPGGPDEAADPKGTLSSLLALKRLQTPAGLAGCLGALQDPADPSAPLAVDYASFAGSPAMVVVLPGARPDRVDVFVVGPACGPADATVRYVTQVTAPR